MTKNDINLKIKELRTKYKEELTNFEYIYDASTLINAKKKFIRYVGFDNKINYGGFLVKVEKIGNNFYIYLINKYKRIWNVDFNRNYVFAVDLLSHNDKMRKEFEKYLSQLN
jgi:hypothetical protein